jgi:hypothetical protein
MTSKPWNSYQHLKIAHFRVRKIFSIFVVSLDDPECS